MTHLTVQDVQRGTVSWTEGEGQNPRLWNFMKRMWRRSDWYVRPFGRVRNHFDRWFKVCDWPHQEMFHITRFKLLGHCHWLCCGGRWALNLTSQASKSLKRTMVKQSRFYSPFESFHFYHISKIIFFTQVARIRFSPFSAPYFIFFA